MTASATREWDAETYERVASPQQRWAEPVLDRLALRGDETVLDAGCGSGRVTRMLVERLPRGRVIAVDGSAAMVEQVRSVLRPCDRAIVADLAGLELDGRVDAIFSNAVLHWIADHDALFRRFAAALAPGGRLEAQCGGHGNVRAFHAATAAVAAGPRFRAHFEGWLGPWNFATAAETSERLARAGLVEVRCWTEERPVSPEQPEDFLRTVCLGPHLDRLPAQLRDEFLAAVVDAAASPLVLDYVRLNVSARLP